MSPAPYPPLHAGDDVDASFFDQLGDELDFPASEGVPHKQQDVGDLNLSGAPGNLEYSSPAQGSWTSKGKSHAEEPGEVNSQNEGNSHLDFELDDAFSELNIGKQDLQSGFRPNSSALQSLSNGDDHVEDPEAKVVPVLASSQEDMSGVRLYGGCELEPKKEDPLEDSGDLGLSMSSSYNIPSEDCSPPGPDLSKELASSLTPDGIAKNSDETSVTTESTNEEAQLKPTEASKGQMQTTDVTEIQWSDFGAATGFGSFSDLLSVFPPDSSQQQGLDASIWNSGADFFQLTSDSQPDSGSVVPEKFFANATSFDVQGICETQTAGPTEQATLRQEIQTPGQSNSEDLTAYWQSQGQDQQAQVDQVDQVEQVEWQIAYPGWWYNNWTGEWREVASNGGGTDTGSAWDSSGQYQNLSQTETSQTHWPHQEPEAVPPQTIHQSVVANGNAPTSQSAAGTYHNEMTETQSSTGNSNLIHNPLFEAPVVEQPGATWPSTAEQVQTSWEDQYPGWYYDYQTQEWKETNQSVQSAVTSTSQLPEVQREAATSMPVAPEELVGYAENSSYGYGVAGWTATQEPQHTSASQSTESNYISHDITSKSSMFDISSSPFQVQSGPSVITTEITPPQWTGEQPDAQFGNPSTYYPMDQTQSSGLKRPSEVGKPQPNGLQNHQYHPAHQAPYSVQHIDPQVPPQQSHFDHYSNSQTTLAQMGNYMSQIHQLPEISYNQFSTPQVPNYGAPTWPTSNTHHMQQPLSSSFHTQQPGGNFYSTQQPVGNSYQSPHYPQYAPMTPPKSAMEALRTSVGRPPHVLTTFGFGGKFVVMKIKDPVSLQASDGNQSISSGQAWVPGPIDVHSLSQLVTQGSGHGRKEPGNLYFSALSRQTFSGPLAGGSISNKELLKWLEERGANCQIEEPDCRNPASLLMLWGLLKVACQHYGKLRSAVGTTGITSQEEDGPEVALANLLTSGGNQGPWTLGSFASTVCLQPVPSEHQLQATASEVKKLLVMGKRKEALKYALQGQLWGPGLVLARQLGEKSYTDAVAQMAQCQFLPGSPMRTLSLLIAGQPAEVFSEKNMPVIQGTNAMQVPSMSGGLTQDGLGSMLEEWQENLSIMAANRTNGDDRVISHLGDCLWKVKGEVAAAHICYLVADANFEPFSSTARLCLIGADHWTNPRTYATPEAIQRTEVYEYSKVLGNPQFTLVAFQPYKLIYASMLAEAGKSSEALRYCQSVLKTLKTASRAPEVEACRQAALALEERLRYHTQGGHAGNLAPGKLVRTFFSALDRGIHGIIGGPPQASDQPQSSSKVETINPLQDQFTSNFSGSSPGRSTPPLVPSASAEKLKEVSRSMPPRSKSQSEPDFNASMKEQKTNNQTKTNNGAGPPGVLGRWGSTIFQKAGGMVGFVKSKKEAKLGEKNMFYYDEKLKMWVEEGVKPSEEEATLAPPPMSTKFASKIEESTSDMPTGAGTGPKAAPRSALSGTPPVPPSNQFSARTKQGVRSRYVDTFNKGANATAPKPVTSSLFPTAKAGGAPMQPMNFFVPGPSLDNPSNGSSVNTENRTVAANSEENHVGHHADSTSSMEDRLDTSQNTAAQNSFSQLGRTGSSMHRVASAENTSAVDAVEGNDRTGRNTSNGGIGLANGYHSRANSWGGYPSNYQTSQFVAEPPPSSTYDNSTVTSFSMYNGFSSQGSTTSAPSVSSYFPSPPSKVDTYYPNSSDGLTEVSLLHPPSIEPFTSTLIGAGASDGRAATQAPVSLVGDDLQEVEL